MIKINKNEQLELEVLNHVEASPLLTTRKLADKLGVSVKLSHALLTGMVKRGLFHIKKHHSRRWDYFLTPKGIAEKARLTYEFLDFSMQFYHEARKRSSQICREIAESGKKKVAFLGATELAEIAYLGVKEWNLELVEVFSDEKNIKQFLGSPVKAIKEIEEYEVDVIIVCLFDKETTMSGKYLPPNIMKLDNLCWVF
jgi:DNA-binding MarR family transcriptional regulator